VARRKPKSDDPFDPVIRVRRIHRRDLNRVWEFLKRVFRDVNRETVEYQRPRTKTRFLEIYEEEGIEQLLFEVHDGATPSVVGYAECAYEVIGSDNWINERYFENRDMRPLFVEEIAIHPDYQGRGIGSFVIEQLEHLARVRGCTHLVLEVAANNKRALQFYRARSFNQIDAAIFLAKKVISEPELLPPRTLRAPAGEAPADAPAEEAPDPKDMAEATAEPEAEPTEPAAPAKKKAGRAAKKAGKKPPKTPPRPEPAAPAKAKAKPAAKKKPAAAPAPKPARKSTRSRG
jgi:ribosomal protein S18 acetylase RimI-like enzyme